MLKRRIIATVVVLDGIAVQSIGFCRYLPLGRPEIAVEFLDRWGVDEINLVDISASRAMRGPDNDMVMRVAKNCHVPLTVAGGIHNNDQIGQLLSSGADKVVINTAARSEPKFVTSAAQLFGNQCIVVSIDAIRDEQGDLWVYDYLEGALISEVPADQAVRMQDAGAGEILLNSVDRDGSYSGFDLGLIASVVNAVTVPVTAAGGAGQPAHFADGFTSTGVSGLAAANFFHFWEHSITIMKSCLDESIPIRRETAFDYTNSVTDLTGRLKKKSDEALKKMLYIQVDKEVI